MGKGSGRRPSEVSDAELQKAWDSIFAGHPTEEQFELVKGKTVLSKPTVDEDDYGNELPSNTDKEKPPKPHSPKDPDRFYDETGDA